MKPRAGVTVEPDQGTITCPHCGERVPFRKPGAGTTLSALQARDPAVVAAFAYIVLGHECPK